MQLFGHYISNPPARERAILFKNLNANLLADATPVPGLTARGRSMQQDAGPDESGPASPTLLHLSAFRLQQSAIRNLPVPSQHSINDENSNRQKPVSACSGGAAGPRRSHRSSRSRRTYPSPHTCRRCQPPCHRPRCPRGMRGYPDS